MTKQVIPMDAYFYKRGSETTPFNINVVPAVTNASFSHLSNDIDYRYAIVDAEETLFMYARDEFSNLQNDNLDVVRVTCRNHNVTDVEGTKVMGVVTPVSEGYWQIKYTLSIASLLWNMTVEIQPNGAGPYYEIGGSPFQIISQVAITAGVNTVISGAGSTYTIAGVVTDFKVTLYDIGNNQRTTGGDQLAVTIVPTPLPSTVADITNIEVFDLLDGTYTVRYLPSSSATDYTVSVTVNLDTVNTKTTTLVVHSNTASPATSEFTSVSLAWPTTAAATVIIQTETYQFYTHIKDVHSNAVTERELTLITEIEGSGQKIYSTATTDDLTTGKYTTTFVVPTSTNRSESLCGTYTVHQYLVQSGGLAASYYPNLWFSPYAEPYLRRIDPVVNFVWNSTEDIIPLVAREYVSIEWTGYLMPRDTGNHEFFVEADDGIRLYVNDVLIIDKMEDVDVG